jgi:hypothetical protein
VEKRLKQLARTARLDGFRPGKVPLSVVRRRFAGQARQEVFGDLVQSTYFEALAQEKLQPAGDPSIEAMDIPPEEGLGYIATIEVMPDVALGDLERARDVLWARWLDRDSDAPGAELGFIERVAVAAVLRATGEPHQADEVAENLVDAAVRMSPLHDRGYLWFNANVALLNGDSDAAVGFFEELVDVGYAGFWEFGTPFMFPWLMADDPRFEPILEAIVTNRDRQLAELKRLRASGMTVAEVREE